MTKLNPTDKTKNAQTLIEQNFDQIFQILCYPRNSSMKGLCSKCYSSNIECIIDENTAEPVCEICQN